MNFMFSYCLSLTSIILTSFNTENVESMADMIEGCSSLISLDLSSFDTRKLEIMALCLEMMKNLNI